MKKISALIIMFALGTVLSFAHNVNSEPSSQLSLEIEKMLAKPSFTFSKKEIKATVLLTLNNDSEIVIIEVKTDNRLVKSFVKSRLNYKKIKNNTIEKGKIYKMPLTILES